ALKKSQEEVLYPGDEAVNGDGTHGILEGYVSKILIDGNQMQVVSLRADCQAESAAALALQAAVSRDAKNEQVAKNLLNYLYFDSELHKGVRGNPNHPAFGLVAWGAIAPAWQVANYGDDNARMLLATMAAAAALESSKWDEAILKTL